MKKIQSLFVRGILFFRTSKIWRIMKLTVFLLLLTVFGVMANETYSQSKKLSLDLRNTTVEDVLANIEDQSEFYFLYSEKVIDVNRRVSLNMEGETIETVLKEIFAGTDVAYTIKDRIIVLSTPEVVNNTFSVDYQQSTITGTVNDENGDPLPGVSVVIKGTTTGTVTNSRGNYSLSNVPSDATLVFSFVGMRTQEVAVGGETVINLTMEADVVGIDEVIAVGYSTKRQSELSSAVSVVDEQTLELGTAAPNLGTLLQGRVPGLIVSGASGHPQDGANVVIRGVGSIGAGYSPLYVVDGIIGGSYYPSDIESVTVLKDAAATGLYGSRAANGVIIITTKSGKGGETKVNYRGSFGLAFHNEGNYDMMNSTELYENRMQAAQNYYDDQVAAGRPDFLNQTFNQYWDNLVPPSVTNTNTYWPDVLTRTGIVNKHNLSLSGGNEKTTFYISANFYDEQGTLLNEEYRQYNLRTNLTHKILDNLQLVWRINGQTERFPNDPFGNSQESLIGLLRIGMPWDPIYEEDGVTPYVPFESGYWYGNAKTNYFSYREHSMDRTQRANIDTDLELKWNITDHITASTSNRFGIGGTDWKQLLDPEFPTAEHEKGRLSQNYTYSYNLLTSNLLKYQNSFDVHNISGLLGQEYSYSKRQNTRAIGTDIPIGLSALAATASPNTVDGDERETGFKSYFAQADYNYDYRYFLVGSARTDASSRFGANNRWANFYTIGASWNLNKEAFLNDVGWLELLKLKFSYGSTGNANIDDYLSLGTYSFDIDNTYNGNSGARPARLENLDLTWEKAYTTNIGVEFAAKNIVRIEVDAYNRENKQLLQSVPLSSASGFSSQERNVGSVRNRGIDLNITTTNLNRVFIWRTNLNLNVNRNKVLYLNNHEDISRYQMRVREGLPLRYFYMKEWAGVDPETGDPQWIRWEDEEGNKIDGGDKIDPANIIVTNNYNQASNLFIKSPYPDFTGGLSNEFYYRNFSASIYCNYVVGNSIYFAERVHMDDDGRVLSKNQINLRDDWSRWEKPGDIATHPRLVLGGNKNSSQNSSRYIEDGSYFRIQNIQFSYNLPYVFSGLRLFVSIDNLAVFTKFSGMDPDLSIESGIGQQYGVPRRIMFGVDLNL